MSRIRSITLSLARYCFLFLLLPLGIVGCVEWSLRLYGYGEAKRPFLRKTHKGEVFFTRNRQFFRPMLFPLQEAWEASDCCIPKSKQPNACRIFLIGESVVHGSPSPHESFGRMLHAMLKRRYPGVRFEVFNTAHMAINSHMLLHQTRTLARLEPDLFIIYMGNNEVHGPFSPVQPPPGETTDLLPLWWIRMYLFARNLRLVQLFSNEQAFSPDRAFGRPLRADNPAAQKIYAYYRQNLHDMIGLAHRAGARTVLCTVPANWRHWCPKTSEHLRPMTEEHKRRWEEHFQRGRLLQQQGDCPSALAEYLRALEMDDTHAELHFHLGTCLWALEDFDAACQHFIQAHELDGFIYNRAKQAINDIICETAEQCADMGVVLADVKGAIREASPHGCPGVEFFYDPCHFNLKGAYLAAQTIFDRVVEILPDWVRRADAGPSSLDFEDCMLMSGIPPVKMVHHIHYVILKHESCSEEVTRALEQVVRDFDSKFDIETHEDEFLFIQSAAQYPEPDPLLYMTWVSGLVERRRHAEALEAAEMFVRDYPHHRAALRLLGQAQSGTGNTDKALKTLYETLTLYPDDMKTYNALSDLLIDMGKSGEAARLWKRAARHCGATDLVEYCRERYLEVSRKDAKRKPDE